MQIVLNNVNKYNMCIRILLLSVLFSPFRSYGLFSIAGFNVSFFRIFGLLMIITILTSLFIYNDRVKIDEVIILIIAIIVYNFIVLIYSNNIATSNFFSMSIGFIWLLFAYILLNFRFDCIFVILKTFIYSSLAPMTWGIYQYVYFKANNILPKEIFPSLLVSEELLTVKYNIYIRVSSTFLEPNYYGMYLVIINILCLGLLLNKKDSIKIFSKNFLNIVLLIYIFSNISVLLTLSLSSLMGLVVATVIILIYNIGVFKINKLKSVIFLVIIMFTLNIFNFEILDSFNFKVINKFSELDRAFGRIDYFNNAVNQIVDNPILGVGFGNLSIGEGIVSSAHNTLLTIMAQQGVIGIILHLLLLFVYPIIFIFINIKRKYNGISSTIYFSVIGMIVVSLSYDAMYKIDANFVVLLLLFVFIKNSKYIHKFYFGDKYV